MKKWETLKRRSTISDLNFSAPTHRRSFWGFSYAPSQPKAQTNQPNAKNTPQSFDTAKPPIDAVVGRSAGSGKDKVEAKEKQNKEENGDSRPKKPDLSSIPRTLPYFLGGGPFFWTSSNNRRPRHSLIFNGAIN
jgi:hypothetical protein